MKTVQSLVASVCLAAFAAGCNPVEPVSAAVVKAAEPMLPFRPDVAPGSADGAVYEYH